MTAFVLSQVGTTRPVRLSQSSSKMARVRKIDGNWAWILQRVAHER